MQIDLSSVSGMGLDLSQYCGLWAVDIGRFQSQLAMVANLNLRAHVEENANRNVAQVPAPKTQGGVAVIDISGTLTKRGSSLSGSGSMTRLRQVIRAAANESEVGGILLRIDSPGGTVAGVADLADEIAAARRKKPLFAFVEDLGASAAYWIAAQAEKVFANNVTAEVGSIGVYMALYDMSRMARFEGVEAVVIRSADLKGAGFPGEPITDEQKSMWQELVDASHNSFVNAVRKGRGMTKEQVTAVATGRVYRASEAQSLGLIDGIQSFEATLADVSRAAVERTKGNRRMSAASYAELLVACEGIDPKNPDHASFLCDQMDAEATAEVAGRAWTRKLLSEAAAARQDAQQARAERAAPGVDPLLDSGGRKNQSDGGYTGDAVADFDVAVRERVAAGMPRKSAIQAVMKANPELHQAFLLATNRPKVHHLIRDRFHTN